MPEMKEKIVKRIPTNEDTVLPVTHTCNVAGVINYTEYVVKPRYVKDIARAFLKKIYSESSEEVKDVHVR